MSDAVEARGSLHAELGVGKLAGIDGAWNSQDKLVDQAIAYHAANLDESFSLPEHFDLAMSLE
jgi:hypothetical protein